MKQRLNVLNVVNCNGAMCVSVNGNFRRYYADGISHRKLKMRRYKYEIK